MINKDGGGDNFGFYGGHSCYEGGHRAHGGIPPVPPLGKTLPWELIEVVSAVR